MSRTIYFTATTLDGFLADEHDGLDWLLTQDHDPQGPGGHEAFMDGVGALVMGRTTYDWVRAHMDRTGEPWAYAIPTWVMTHRPAGGVDGADIRFASGDVTAVHAEMAAAADGRDLWVVGGGQLAVDLVRAGLLDEIRVSIAPVTLGAGRPLLPAPVDLRLIAVDRNRAFVCARYDVVGPRA
ncbi:MAG: dihydrofolate reductase family protein [Thermoleophilia bacterium]